MELGGYLLYMHPGIPVFVDGRTDFNGDELVHEYFIAHQGAEIWSDVLDQYQVRWRSADQLGARPVSCPLKQ